VLALAPDQHVPRNLGGLRDAPVRFSTVVDGTGSAIRGALSDWLS
jgi:hypothetical protein